MKNSSEVRKRRLPSVISVISLGLIAILFVKPSLDGLNENEAVAAERHSLDRPAEAPLGKPDENFDEVRKVATKNISIGAATMFHHKFIERCMPALPEEVELQYDGPLRSDSGRNKFGVEGGGIELALRWSVVADLGYFSFWLSTTKTPLTAVTCRIDKQDLFVNVDFVDSNRGIDEVLPELGKQSVRQVLARLGDKPVGK